MGDTAFREFRVGRFTCAMTYDPTALHPLNVEWSPRVPVKGDLTPAEFDQYRAGRQALLSEVAKKIGGNILVVE